MPNPSRPQPSTASDRHLEAARGWLLLGVPEEAGRELDGVAEAHRLDPRVLVVRAGVFQGLRQWEPLRNVARLLCDARPLEPQWPLSLALATRHLHGPEAAIGILMDAVQCFPREPTVYYDLACCEALLGKLDLARGWLKDAMRLAPAIREKARRDLDLAILWTEF